jgi:hypothetical protein
MVKYTFKLKKSYVPDLTQKKEQDNTYGGIRLIYTIYKTYYISLLGREVPWFRLKLGKKTFLRPYKKFWDKRTYRLPYVYWGKKENPLTRLWIVIPNNYPIGISKIVPEVSLIHQHVKLFGHNFKSREITSQLFGNKDKFQLISI